MTWSYLYALQLWPIGKAFALLARGPEFYPRPHHTQDLIKTVTNTLFKHPPNKDTSGFSILQPH